MFSEFSVRAQQWRDFATAHSRGLRPCAGRVPYRCRPLPQRIRAGCDDAFAAGYINANTLPQRIRAGCDHLPTNSRLPPCRFATAHSRGLRLARSTCAVKRVSFASAHSRGLRLARLIFIICACPLPQRIRAGCDQCANNLRQPDGALPQRIRAGCDDQPHDSHVTSNPLPQRIRAGCDCGKAMQRTANLLREGR